jgi:hypothetical protein
MTTDGDDGWTMHQDDDGVWSGDIPAEGSDEEAAWLLVEMMENDPGYDEPEPGNRLAARERALRGLFGY